MSPAPYNYTYHPYIPTPLIHIKSVLPLPMAARQGQIRALHARDADPRLCLIFLIFREETSQGQLLVMDAVLEETRKHYGEEGCGDDVSEQDLSSEGEVEVARVGGVSEDVVDPVGDQLMSCHFPEAHQMGEIVSAGEEGSHPQSLSNHHHAQSQQSQWVFLLVSELEEVLGDEVLQEHECVGNHVWFGVIQEECCIKRMVQCQLRVLWWKQLTIWNQKQ